MVCDVIFYGRWVDWEVIFCVCFCGFCWFFDDLVLLFVWSCFEMCCYDWWKVILEKVYFCSVWSIWKFVFLFFSFLSRFLWWFIVLNEYKFIWFCVYCDVGDKWCGVLYWLFCLYWIGCKCFDIVWEKVEGCVIWKGFVFRFNWNFFFWVLFFVWDLVV